MNNHVCPKCKKGKMELVNNYFDNVYYSCSNCGYIKNI